MNQNKYLEKQNKLNQKAHSIIEELELMTLLSKYGEVHIVGSVALELMSWPDIDIVVYAEPDVGSFLETINVLFSKNYTYSMNIQDFRKSIYPNRPQGIYCGLKYLEKPDVFWKIDIWFLPESEDSGMKTVRWVKERIDENSRNIILKIKNEMREKLEYGNKISGMTVYEAVLKKNVKNLDEFRKYLKDVNWKVE